jgi:hypothetical protein
MKKIVSILLMLAMLGLSSKAMANTTCTYKVVSASAFSGGKSSVIVIYSDSKKKRIVTVTMNTSDVSSDDKVAAAVDAKLKILKISKPKTRVITRTRS